ncbi:MAG: glycoside hydrolase family 3 C-terminal domain-containing protein, partial [Pseudomonadota bacterium]|nr:glycoside hydrolase family 3 C-terminal domain-containing protein [Pseudomonadota bacterium]
VSLIDGLRNNAPDGSRIDYVAGAHPSKETDTTIEDAVRAASAADHVLLVIGEDYDLSGEARSRSDIALPANQAALAEAVFSTGKPVTLILVTGRPLAIETEADAADAVLNTWMLGVEAGNALADVLWGDVSPAGRLPVEFPRRTGAVPHTYSEYPGGRPADPDLSRDTNRFIDIPITPLFPFGHGLGYSQFNYGDLTSNVASAAPGEEIRLSVPVTNTGPVDADEVVQLYMRDPVATIARPSRELRGFIRTRIPAGATRIVTFTLTPDQAAIYRSDAGWTVEVGRLDFMVGASAADLRSKASVEISQTYSTDAPASALQTKVDVQ